MKLRISDLWTWTGTIGRGAYGLWGAILFLLKHNIDRFVAYKFFGREWSVFNYLSPGGSDSVNRLHGSEVNFYGTLLFIAIPFIVAGLALTVRRLRSAELPLWLTVFFFIPIANLFFFALLAVIPARQPAVESEKERDVKDWLGRLIPENSFGSAALALLISVSLAAGFAQFGVSVLQNYGWGLFVGLPFALGLGSVLIYGYHGRRTYRSCVGVAFISTALLGILMIAIAAEGAICLIMAAPIGFLLSWFGASLGYTMLQRPWQRSEAPLALFIVMLSVPAIMGAESQSSLKPPLFSVTSYVDIDAPPAVVWEHVVTFSELPPPEELLFRVGIAYPLRAKINGHGVGAVRHCVFSTGPFVEPIKVWDEPHLLKFSVTSNPAPMQEWTPYTTIHPPHLDGFLASEGGQFRLIALPGGRTRLEGTTWYRHHMWPANYWQWWSDYIIHRIHMRVLNHVKQLSEQSGRSVK
jgi:uncharacterized membrane protein YhaH (DUF805 family)